MINGSYLASRLVEHAIDEMGVPPKNVSRYSDSRTDFYGLEYIFNADAGGFDIEIEPLDLQELEGFNKFLKSTQEKDFWTKGFLQKLDKKRRRYRRHLGNLTLDLNGDNHYHFKGKFNTKNKDDAFFAILNNVVKVAALYRDPRIRQ